MTVVQYLQQNGIGAAEMMALAKEDKEGFSKLKNWAREEMTLLGVEITEQR